MDIANSAPNKGSIELSSQDIAPSPIFNEPSTIVKRKWQDIAAPNPSQKLDKSDERDSSVLQGFYSAVQNITVPNIVRQNSLFFTNDEIANDLAKNKRHENETKTLSKDDIAVTVVDADSDREDERIEVENQADDDLSDNDDDDEEDKPFEEMSTSEIVLKLRKFF